ncbi:MarR family transcriptional regulator [Microbacterium sp. STN6]|uniref:sugar-binding transcriptional regulator n=1 Tax=Microbacterium sp. STN6 TaxID=2995588 RepID=UPI002260A04D|nr:sugar-binding domain-containing protein [Microbacterium sp. STN6]MCX7522708.1 MarR family transcriptional regulator [Microbacterium sp. STN6]
MSMEANASRLATDRMSLLTKIARMYHEQGMRQPEIAARLGISQSRVSRFLKEAVTLGVVRTVVVPPPGVYSELEDAVRDRYGLRDVVVAEAASDDDRALLNALGAAGAAYLETTLTGGDRVGLSSWSSTLLATVDKMSPRPKPTASAVVQVLGGVGNPAVQVQATRLTDRLARVTGADAQFLPVPGIVANSAVRDALLADPNVADVAAEWARLTVLLVGIGSLQPSPLLKDSGNAISETEQQRLRERGAVGDVCLRFFDAAGELVDTDLGDRVLGISVEQLRAIDRTVGIAGGERKHEAIRAAALGGWLDVLITDLATARFLTAG